MSDDVSGNRLSAWYELFSRGARDWLRHNEKVRDAVREHLPQVVSGADVLSRGRSTVRVPVRLLPELMPGTVALPHGWGHQAAEGLSVASRTRGVNVNLLSPDGPDRIEKLSGMAHLTGFVVDVKPAAGEQAHDWSGLPR